MILVFYWVARVRHVGQGLTPDILVERGWPFMVAVLVMYAVTYAIRRAAFDPAAFWPDGVIIWFGTSVLGVGLRALTDMGNTHWSFIGTGSAFLVLFLLGWRCVLFLVERNRTSSQVSA